MKRKAVAGIVWCLVVGVGAQQLGSRLFGSGVAEGQPLIIPQMFNSPGGDSLVVLQNLSAAPQDISVEFFAQDGSFFDLVTAAVAGMGEAQVPTPAAPGGGEFRGSVLIFGNGPFAARGQWNFNIAGTPLAVGVPSILMSRTSTVYQMPIGSVGAGSLVGVAIENPGGTPIDCSVAYRDQNGQTAAEDAYSIPAFGQVSGFASGIMEGFEGSGTVQCNGPAAVTAVIQEQVNGFPTPIFAVPGF